MKSEIFKNELQTIKNDDIRAYAVILLDKAPDYFYHVAASSTGRYHSTISLGDGGLVRHTKAVLRFYNHLMGIEQNSSLFTEREIDLGRVACLVHDIQKSGNETDYAKKSNNGEKKVFTVFDHPLLAAKYVLTEKKLSDEELKFIAAAVCSHMGEFNTDKRNPGIVLPKPKTEMQKLVHLADYLASRKDLTVSFDEDTYAYSIPDINEYTLTFGKYIGKKLTEVPKDYLVWLEKNNLLNKEPLKTLGNSILHQTKQLSEVATDDIMNELPFN